MRKEHQAASVRLRELEELARAVRRLSTFCPARGPRARSLVIEEDHELPTLRGDMDANQIFWRLLPSAHCVVEAADHLPKGDGASVQCVGLR